MISSGCIVGASPVGQLFHVVSARRRLLSAGGRQKLATKGTGFVTRRSRGAAAFITAASKAGRAPALVAGTERWASVPRGLESKARKAETAQGLPAREATGANAA